MSEIIIQILKYQEKNRNLNNSSLKCKIRVHREIRSKLRYCKNISVFFFIWKQFLLWCIIFSIVGSWQTFMIPCFIFCDWPEFMSKAEKAQRNQCWLTSDHLPFVSHYPPFTHCYQACQWWLCLKSVFAIWLHTLPDDSGVSPGSDSSSEIPSDLWAGTSDGTWALLVLIYLTCSEPASGWWICHLNSRLLYTLGN